MIWLALGLGVLATGALLHTIHRTGEKIMATNAEQLNSLKDALTGIAAQQTQGLDDLAGLLEGLRAESNLDFGAVNEVVARLRVGTQALDDITPNEVLPDETDPDTDPEPEPEVPPVTETPEVPPATDEDDEGDDEGTATA